jgi:GTP-binding protein
LHVIDIAPLDESCPIEAAKTIINELKEYDSNLLNKPRWLVLNKIDCLPNEEIRQQTIARVVKGLSWTGKVFSISAISKTGTSALCYALMQFIDEMKAESTE